MPGTLIPLVERLQGVCLRRELTVSLAESCTGGFLAASLTEVAGSSGYFLGGVVSYANRAKEALLDVPAATLAAHGAVSAQTARAMAQGARLRFGSSLAASITGVAGPDGGSTEKPVGLVYVALATDGGVDVRRLQLTGDRRSVREGAARAALEVLIEAAEAAEAAGAAIAGEAGVADDPGAVRS